MGYRKYNLVLIAPKKNPMPIDITLLDNDILDSSIESIDIFTSKYTKDDLINLIHKSNIVTSEYLFGDLYILDNNKYKLEVFTKNLFGDFILEEFIKENISNLNLMNTIYNIFSQYTKNHNIALGIYFKEAVLESKFDEISEILRHVPYIARRKFEFYVFNIYKKMLTNNM